MRICTINLPEKYLDAIRILEDNGVVPSRSEAVRLALRDFLSNELKIYQDLDPDKFKLYVKSNAGATKKPLKSTMEKKPDTGKAHIMPVPKEG